MCARVKSPNGWKDSKDVARMLLIRVVDVLSLMNMSSSVFVTSENYH